MNEWWRADFFTEDLVKYFPKLMPLASITLVQSSDHILNTYDKKISECTSLLLLTQGKHRVSEEMCLKWKFFIWRDILSRYRTTIPSWGNWREDKLTSSRSETEWNCHSWYKNQRREPYSLWSLCMMWIRYVLYILHTDRLRYSLIFQENWTLFFLQNRKTWWLN